LRTLAEGPSGIALCKFFLRTRNSQRNGEITVCE
jgi:primosomal replication protein N